MLPMIVLPAGTVVDAGALGLNVGWTLLKVAAFVLAMLFVGGRVLPWVLVRIAHTRSRALFTLGVLAIALGIAWIAYQLFHSFALGAFLAGLVLNGTPLGHNAAERSLPLRDAFAVLFFVSRRDVVRSQHPVARAAVGAGRAGNRHRRQDGRCPGHHHGLQTGPGHQPDGRGQPGPGGRVLFHLGRARRLAGRHEPGHPRPDPGRRALLSISLNPFVFLFMDRMGGKLPGIPPENEVNPATA